MNEAILYRERLPKHLFNTPHLKRETVLLVQWWFRLGAIAILLGTVYLAVSPKTEHDLAPTWVGIIVAWIGSIILLNYSERRDQAELDGNVPTIIYENKISIPPRLHRKLTGEPNFVERGEVNHIEVSRKDGIQYTAKKRGVIWENSPTGLHIVTTSGKKIGLGRKPPSTVKEIVDVLTKHWNVRVEDSGSGMGRGLIFVNNNVVSEHSYDEIVKMSLFEWR